MLTARSSGLLLMLALVAAACGGYQSAAPEPAAPPTPSAADEGSREPANPLDVIIEDYGFGKSIEDDDFLTYGVILANPNPSTWAASGVQLELTWFDDSGSVVGRETARIYLILPGQRAARAGRTFDVDSALASSLRVQLRTSDWLDIGPGPYGGLEVTDVTLRDDSVTGQVRSTFDAELEMLGAFAVFRDDAGKIAGGWSEPYGIDFIPPGGQASVQVYRPADFEASTAELFVQPNSLSFPD